MSTSCFSDLQVLHRVGVGSRTPRVANTPSWSPWFSLSMLLAEAGSPWSVSTSLLNHGPTRPCFVDLTHNDSCLRTTPSTDTRAHTRSSLV